MKPHAHGISAWRAGAALLLAVLFAAGLEAQDPPASPPAPEADAGAPPAPAADAPPVTIPSDLERLAEALPDEHRVLKAGDESFDVFVRAITGGPPKGATKTSLLASARLDSIRGGRSFREDLLPRDGD